MPFMPVTVVECDPTPSFTLPVANPAGWWDPSQTDSLVVTSTGRLKSCLDLSGNDNHLGVWAATAALDDPGALYGARTINGITVPDFQASMRFAMSCMSPRDDRSSSTFSVVETDTIAAGLRCFIGANGSGALEQRLSADDLQTVTSATLMAQIDNLVVANVPFVAAQIVTATDVTQYVNTTSETDANATALTAGRTLMLGGDQVNSQPWDGAIAEVVYFDRTLSTNETDSLITYLKAKWGIA